MKAMLLLSCILSPQQLETNLVDQQRPNAREFGSVHAFRVKAGDRQGTAVLLKIDGDVGYFATCYHVLSSSRECHIFTWDGISVVKPNTQTFIYRFWNHDLVILRMNLKIGLNIKPLDYLKTLPPEGPKSFPMKEGFAIGYPGVAPEKPFPVRVRILQQKHASDIPGLTFTKTRPPGDDGDLSQLTVRLLGDEITHPGMSGGSVVTMDGKFAGLVLGRIDESVCLMLPAGIVAKAVEKASNASDGMLRPYSSELFDYPSPIQGRSQSTLLSGLTHREQIERLERAHNDLQVRMRRLIRGVDRVVGQGDYMVRVHPEIAPLVLKLSNLVGQYDGEKDTFIIYLADLAAAFSKGEYETVLSSLKYRIDAEIAAEQAQSQRVVTLLEYRADSNMQLRQWDAALRDYNAIQKRRPENKMNRLDILNCKYQLGLLREALDEYTELIHLFEQQGTAKEVSLVASGRGRTLIAMGRLQEAIKNYTTAIDLLSEFDEDEIEEDVAAILNNRGNAYNRIGEFALSLDDFNRAVVIRRRLINEGKKYVEGEHAMSLANRGLAFHNNGRLHEALRDLNEAIDMYDVIVDAQKYLEDDFALALGNRGLVLLGLCSSSRSELLPKAIMSFNRAVSMYTTLIGDGRKDLESEFAAVLTNRGDALKMQGKTTDAIVDFKKALDIHTRLVEQEGQVQFEAEYARSITNWAVALFFKGKTQEAIGECTRAVDIFKTLAKSRVDYRRELAQALRNRGDIIYSACFQRKISKAHLSHGARDYDEAIGILNDLVAGPYPHLKPELDKTKLWRSRFPVQPKDDQESR